MTHDTERHPALADFDYRIVLEHTHGPMKGIHSICGLRSQAVQPMPEFLDAVDLIDSPAMRKPGPVSLVAVKRKHILYRQITTPEMQNGKNFNRSQR